MNHFSFLAPNKGESLLDYCRRAREGYPVPLVLLIKTHRLFESIANDNS